MLLFHVFFNSGKVIYLQITVPNNDLQNNDKQKMVEISII